MWITPRHQYSDFSYPLTIDDKITIFVARIRGWQLDIADQCIRKIEHSGFAVLHIVFSYFEMISKYKDGYTATSKSEYYFKQGIRYVFPQLNTQPSDAVNILLHLLYTGCRCGLYHIGLTDPRIIIDSRTVKSLDFNLKSSTIIINPKSLIKALRNNLQCYEIELRNNNNTVLRQNFEKRFDFDSMT